jgi:hypothetical protein
MSWLMVVVLVPFVKIATWLAVNLLRLLVAFYALLVVCLLTYFLLMEVSDHLNIPMPWLGYLLRLVRSLSSNL